MMWQPSSSSLPYRTLSQFWTKRLRMLWPTLILSEVLRHRLIRIFVQGGLWSFNSFCPVPRYQNWILNVGQNKWILNYHPPCLYILMSLKAKFQKCDEYSNFGTRIILLADWINIYCESIIRPSVNLLDSLLQDKW